MTGMLRFPGLIRYIPLHILLNPLILKKTTHKYMQNIILWEVFWIWAFLKSYIQKYQSNADNILRRNSLSTYMSLLPGKSLTIFVIFLSKVKKSLEESVFWRIFAGEMLWINVFLLHYFSKCQRSRRHFSRQHLPHHLASRQLALPLFACSKTSSQSCILGWFWGR